MSNATAHISWRGALRRLQFLLLALGLATALIASADQTRQIEAGENEDYELEGRAPTVVELQPAVVAAFARDSYAPGEQATLRLEGTYSRVRVQVFHTGPETVPTTKNDEMNGIPVTPPSVYGAPSGGTIRIRIGDWPSGLYFARLTAANGLVGFAPFVVRPRRLGEHRVAVVLPTYTWQAYNLRDEDGDGKGDSWYANWSVRRVSLARPFLSRGVPPHFRAYDLPFLHWLARSGKAVDILTDLDLERIESGDTLARAYDLIIFPGHHEYVTTREYDLVTRYRDLGGNLMFLSANNFFWRVVRQGTAIRKTEQWRDLGRPEASLLGVQYRANDRGEHRGAFVVRDTQAGRWVFAGTGLRPGSGFGSFGIEIDKTTAESPRGVEVLAEIPDLLGPGRTAQMTYYQTSAGARVFAAGVFTLAGAAETDTVALILENVWRHLTDEPR